MPVIDSPFEPVFAPFGDRVPAAFREQFLLSPEAGYRIRLEGTMDVWRPAWLAPLFWGLGAAGILIARTGRDIPTTVYVTATRDARGAPHHRFERIFRFARPARFITTTSYDLPGGHLVDATGPGQLLRLRWSARFEPPGTFRLIDSGYAWGRFVLPQAAGRLLFGASRFAQTVDAEKPDTIHLDFTIGHPLLGDIFGYRGTFRVGRVSA